MKPRLSILIPTRNRRDLLAQTLATLSRQSVPSDRYETIVASDGSTDGTPSMVRQLAATPDWDHGRLTCIEQEWRGASAARNAALRAARGDLILYLDDDTLAEPDLVAAHLAVHDATRAESRGQVVIGHVAVEGRPEAIHRELQRWWAGHFERLKSGTASFTAFFTANVSMPRQALCDAGGFDEQIDYGEDVDAGYRLWKLGLSVIYEPAAVVHTRNPKPASSVLHDLQRIGQGNVRLYHKSPETLAFLPLSAYGETSVRMRIVQGVLLRASQRRLVAWLIDRILRAWASSFRSSRADRPMFELARSYYFWRGVRSEVRDRREWARLLSPGVTVLTYHSVDRVAGPPQRFTVDTGRFARQMRLLRTFGYRVVPLERVVARWEQGRLPSPRSVAITFDDGYRDNLTQAWPVLRRLGYAATLFFVAGSAGADNGWERSPDVDRKPMLTWDEIRTLDRQGFRVESHTTTHLDLYRATPGDLAREIAGSRVALEAELGRRVTLFAYPYGHYTGTARRAVEEAGYRAAFSVRRGLNTLRTDRLALRRVTISGDDGLLMFFLKVWCGDDPLQYVPLLGRLSRRKWSGSKATVKGFSR